MFSNMLKNKSNIFVLKIMLKRIAALKRRINKKLVKVRRNFFACPKKFY